MPRICRMPQRYHSFGNWIMACCSVGALFLTGSAMYIKEATVATKRKERLLIVDV